MTEKSDWLEVECVRRAFLNAQTMVSIMSGEWYGKRVRERLAINGETHVESPLEAMFVAWWSACDWFKTPRQLLLHAQRQVRAEDSVYRLDFVIEPDMEFLDRANNMGLSWTPIAVELDGHAFHEKTQEQVTRRNKRDRDLQHAGWRVFHLSYDEMNRDGFDPVAEIFIAATAQLKQLNQALIDVSRAPANV
jgi:hypothetical protein